MDNKEFIPEIPEEPIYYCTKCGREIYRGDIGHIVDGKVICDGCHRGLRKGREE